MPLSAKVTSVQTKSGETSKTVKLKLLDGMPSHLRVLGQKVTVSSPDKDVNFIVGPDVKKVHTYSVPSGAEAPAVMVVGPEDSTFALVYKGSCCYKNA